MKKAACAAFCHIMTPDFKSDMISSYSACVMFPMFMFISLKTQYPEKLESVFIRLSSTPNTGVSGS